MNKIDIQDFIVKLEDVFDTIDKGTLTPEGLFVSACYN